MKKLLIILFLCLVSGVYGQQVNAPEAKSFALSTSGQSASGFSLSGFSETATLLCAIGLPQAPVGTTFYITTTTGLTSSIGYTLTGNKTRLTFTGTQTNINNALASLKVNTTGTSGSIQISVSATVNPTGYFYLPTNGHFYRPMSGFVGVGFSGTSPTAYDNLKNYCTQQTFKGQSGYLMTITSSDEDNFVFNNVPGSNIIFALTDNVTEGTFKIDAGPEAGTITRIGGTNQTGKYNNWAGGEPNNYGSGEDYVVTKWGGGNQWNDYGPEATPFPGGVSGYVIEYGTWTNPDDQTFTDFYNNSVTHSNGNTLRLQFVYDFGSNLNETLFKTKLFSNYNNIQVGSLIDYSTLSSLGKIDMTTHIDQTKISEGKKALTAIGDVEWSIINPYDVNLGGHRLQIDEREFYGTGINLNDIKSIKLFDIYEGPIQPLDFNGWWKQWVIPGNINLATKISTSTFQPYFRLQDGWYGIRAEYTFADNSIYKPHYSDMKYFGTTHSALFNSIVTVGDVYLAFKQLSDNGIFGNSNVHFTTPIQFANADVDSSGTFNEQDCFILLKHLLGETTIWSNTTDLNNMVKFIKKSDYDAITNTTWQNYVATSSKYNLPTIVDGQLNSYNIAVTWRGDVNLSHSAIPAGTTQPLTNSLNQLTTMSVKTMSTSNNVVGDIWMELKDGLLEISITVTPNGNEIGATQFNVAYDNTILDYTKTDFTNKNDINFARVDPGSLNVGTLNTSGLPISNIGYKLYFKPKTTIKNILGLVSIQNIETIDTKSKQLKILIQ